MDLNVIIEGDVKFRDRRKLYRDNKDRYKQGMTKASLSLEHFLGTETGFTLDKESNTAAIVCRDVIVILAFDSRERLIQWQMKINYNLGESTQFLIQISSSPMKAKLTSGPARMHIQNNSFCVTSSVPPKQIGYWEIKHLRRYGVVDGRFCFEGGSLCGRGEGLYIFLSDECEDIVSSMRAASQGKLLPKKRHISRNMSVIESPRRYMQRTPESHGTGPSSLPSAASNSSCQLFATYEWASTISNEDTASEGKYSNDYLFQAQSQILPNHWSDFDFDKLTNAEFNFDQEAFYEPYASQVNLHANTKELKSTDQPDDLKVHGQNRVPERPPKPTKSFKSVNETPNTVIKSSHPPSVNSLITISNENTSELKKPCDDYDVPQTFCSSIETKSCNEHSCTCIESKKTCKEERTVTKLNAPNLYDVPPVAMPVNTVCSCTSKMRVIVESENYYSHKLGKSKTVSCPCQHFITCWPYNWLQLAYCRRGNTIQDTSIPFKMVDYVEQKPKIDPASLYAQVDLSKKMKNKLIGNSILTASTVSDAATPPPRPTEPKPRLNTEANNSYTNLYFENTLKYYENARELIKNTSPARDDVSSRNQNIERCCKTCSITCAKKQRASANYIVMNPVCAAIQQLEPFARQRSDSLGSAKSASVSMRQQAETGQDSSKLTKSDTPRSTRVGSTGNRDSSSSNDSGFSFGSLKGANGEIQYQPLISRRGGGGSNSLKSSELGACGVGSNLPTCHQRFRKEESSTRVEGVSSIPFIDSQSTSSEASDISDYIETLSLSSHSSSDNSNLKMGAHHPASTVLRPRSGKEYEKVNRVLLQRRADDQDTEETRCQSLE